MQWSLKSVAALLAGALLLLAVYPAAACSMPSTTQHESGSGGCAVHESVPVRSISNAPMTTCCSVSSVPIPETTFKVKSEQAGASTQGVEVSADSAVCSVASSFSGPPVRPPLPTRFTVLLI